jgi:cytochrome c556
MNTAQLTLHLTLGSMIALAACRDSSAAPAHQAPPKTGAPAAPSAVDGRTPVPLTAMMATHQKRDMRDHLRAVQEITAALARDDFGAIAASAARIGWSDQQAAKCKHMGAGAPGFAALGEHFHRTADQISEAARRRDRPGVVHALDVTLQTCVGCHESFRQEIVADAKAAGAAGMDDSCPMMQGK